MGKSLTETSLINSFYTFGLNILGKYKLNKHILKSHLMSKAASRIARVVDGILIQRGRFSSWELLPTIVHVRFGSVPGSLYWGVTWRAVTVQIHSHPPHCSPPASVCEVWRPSHCRLLIICEIFILHLILWLTKIFSLGIKDLFSSLCSTVKTHLSQSVFFFSFSNFYSRCLFFPHFSLKY